MARCLSFSRSRSSRSSFSSGRSSLARPKRLSRPLAFLDFECARVRLLLGLMEEEEEGMGSEDCCELLGLRTRVVAAREERRSGGAGEWSFSRVVSVASRE